jgi:hypothetical protein
MSGVSPRALRSLDVARNVYNVLATNNIESAIIGSVALALHGYVRGTRDLDLGVAVLRFAPLQRVADELRDQGYEVDVGEPAPDDPLRGVVTVSGTDFDPIQVMNLRAPGGRHERLAREAIATAKHVPELRLPVVDLAHLIALKLVAGARKDELDILELVSANPETPLASILDLCRRYRLKTRLEELLRSNDGR